MAQLLQGRIAGSGSVPLQEEGRHLGASDRPSRSVEEPKRFLLS
ncbi:hypothetical protein BN1708_014095 [Verticillium longisporum]|uniref:Uncharacterized protein n=1 Tax=Verticillium longisporum TaxID=100787 RepID=A0A0G4LSL5_VERLO|nr:hypothetical protein BN1708_014095 [Verticillium longisporum]